MTLPQSPNPFPIRCLLCETLFLPKRRTQRFHTKSCKDKYHNLEKARMVAEMKHITQGAKL